MVFYSLVDVIGFANVNQFIDDYSFCLLIKTTCIYAINSTLGRNGVNVAFEPIALEVKSERLLGHRNTC
jgi:hypothetical protein